jgi:FHA domain
MMAGSSDRTQRNDIPRFADDATPASSWSAALKLIRREWSMRIQLRVEQSGGPAKTLDVAGDPVRFGRDAQCEFAVDPIVFPKVSGLHAQIESTAQGLVLVHLSRNNKTLLNDALAWMPMEGKPANKLACNRT